MSLTLCLTLTSTFNCGSEYTLTEEEERAAAEDSRHGGHGGHRGHRESADSYEDDYEYEEYEEGGESGVPHLRNSKFELQ